MSEAQTKLCKAVLQLGLLSAAQCQGQSSISEYSACDFYARNGTDAAVPPKRRFHLVSYESTTYNRLRSLLKGTFRLWVHEGEAKFGIYAEFYYYYYYY
jgi:hypothetical protein